MKGQHCGIKNRNNRRYPHSVWERHCRRDADFMLSVKRRMVWGQLEHPADGRSDLREAAIVITECDLRPNGELYVTFETLSTHRGQTGQALIKDGIAIGLSSRAHGSVARANDGVDEVQEDFTPETFDLVADPSTPGAYLSESTLAPADRLLQERKAKLHVQAKALLDECLGDGDYRPDWGVRYADIVFWHQRCPSDIEFDGNISLLGEAITMKRTKAKRLFRKSLNSKSQRILEAIEDYVDDANNAVEEIQNARHDISAVSGEADVPDTGESNVHEIEAQVAAEEARAALEVAEEKIATGEADEQILNTCKQLAMCACAKAQAAASALANDVVPDGVDDVVPERIGDEVDDDLLVPSIVAERINRRKRKNGLRGNGLSRGKPSKRNKLLSEMIMLTKDIGDVVCDAVNAVEQIEALIADSEPSDVVNTKETQAKQCVVIADVAAKTASCCVGIAQGSTSDAEVAVVVQKVKDCAAIADHALETIEAIADSGVDEIADEITTMQEELENLDVSVPVPDAAIEIEDEDDSVVAESRRRASHRIAAKSSLKIYRKKLRESEIGNKKLVIENNNLKLLNSEMTRLFEQEIMKNRVGYLIKLNPKLDKYNRILYNCRNMAHLMETVKELNTGLIEHVQKEKTVVRPRRDVERPQRGMGDHFLIPPVVRPQGSSTRLEETRAGDNNIFAKIKKT